MIRPSLFLTKAPPFFPDSHPHPRLPYKFRLLRPRRELIGFFVLFIFCEYGTPNATGPPHIELE